MFRLDFSDAKVCSISYFPIYFYVYLFLKWRANVDCAQSCSLKHPCAGQLELSVWASLCSWVVTALWPWSWKSAPAGKHACAFRQIPWHIWCWQVVWTPSNTLNDSGSSIVPGSFFSSIFLIHHWNSGIFTGSLDLPSTRSAEDSARPTSNSSAGLSVSSAFITFSS